ncbi:MAG: YesU family protein [Bacteroidia bacterium]|nr:YesU family protein [Bacteroidia bacterium]
MEFKKTGMTGRDLFFYPVCTLLVWAIFLNASFGQSIKKGKLEYELDLMDTTKLQEWRMEGQGRWNVRDAWLQLYSPGESGHFVFWCPQEFPADFIAEWEVQNLHPEAGLCIVFFAATGLHGEDLFSEKLAGRTGVFKQYTQGDINNYHLSYYANNPREWGRVKANLRKNKGFKKVQSLREGIPKRSKEVHRCRLVKHGGKIQFFVDDRVVIDWKDEQALGGGKIGWRQMKWTNFRYRNFRVWSVE